MIERTFQDIPDGKLSEADQQSFLVSLGWSSETTWEDLLRSKRVLMIGEAGTGKTYECDKQAQCLQEAGKPAFFIELSELAAKDLQSLLDPEEEMRLDAWLSSQSEVATFFLDSIDELKLTRRSFKLALKSLKKVIGKKLRQSRIIIATRPIPFDEQLVRRLLPIPPAPSREPPEETFAKIAMGDQKTKQFGDKDDDTAPDWRTVALMPLSDAQIVEFARDQDVNDPEKLLDDLQKQNAQEFARRPQDLIELCADWRESGCIRSHRDQVATNVHVKLQPSDNRPELAELSSVRAIEGASRLALAMMVTHRMTIRHSAASDDIEDEAALNPAIILSDWNLDERKALLERSLFSVASFGRVRFHHRSVVEFLVAERLRALRSQGMSLQSLKRLIFVKTKEKTIVRPTMRPVAGWLALSEYRIFEMLRDNEPAVLLDEGDPEALSQSQRKQALRAYVEQYGHGGWRGRRVPTIQVHRFASPELAEDIIELWGKGIENPEVRQTLLHLIEAGRIDDCADLAHGVARDDEASLVERLTAFDAMVAISDPRLKEIASEVAANDPFWPDKIARGVLLRLFPRHLSIKKLCQTLRWIEEGKHSVGDLSWNLPRLITDAELNPTDLKALRNGLVELLSIGLRWNEKLSHIICDRSYLSSALAATCLRGLDGSKSDLWLYASVLAVRLNNQEYGKDEAQKELQERLRNLSADENARLFWTEDSLVQSLNPISDPWMRLVKVTSNEGIVKLRAERDLNWIKEALSDISLSEKDRAMLLEAAICLEPNREKKRDFVSGLKPLVADQQNLIETIDERLKPSKLDKELELLEKKEAQWRKQEEQKKAEAKTKWIEFWREVVEHPESVFSSERSSDTAWNLWQVMSRYGEYSRKPGWNRRFIEEHFGKETADKLCLILMKIWRENKPTLPSERPEEQRGSYLDLWLFGLAGLYAEAEDPSWANKLSEEEAKRAVRYAAIQFNWLPNWMESLVYAHPGAVDEILGNELTQELERNPGTHGHSALLQKTHHTSDSVAKLFLPRIRGWLDGDGDIVYDANSLSGAATRLRQVIGVVLKHGDEDTQTQVLAVARKRLQDKLPDELAFVWLPTLMHLDPELGVSALEERLGSVEPSARSDAVKLFSILFGDPHDTIDLKIPGFTPQLLLRLLRLTYQHVRPVDDAKREGHFSPDIRDKGERARNEIVTALFDAKGEEGWAAKMEMANDPLCAYFKDRIIAVAKERWAEEMDSVAFDEKQAVALDNTGEAPASTNEAMFAIMRNRLQDFDDLLLSDTSPREIWAGINEEKLMRRAIARELEYAANGLYKVDQEAVTGEEKETDIRLRSVVSAHEAVIELKIADHRSASDLRDTINEQLVKKYMAPETRRAGCLLITLAKDRTWKHPQRGTSIGPEELKSLLRNEAKRVEEKMGGNVKLLVHLLDLRPGLPVEKLR